MPLYFPDVLRIISTLGFLAAVCAFRLDPSHPPSISSGSMPSSWILTVALIPTSLEPSSLDVDCRGVPRLNMSPESSLNNHKGSYTFQINDLNLIFPIRCNLTTQTHKIPFVLNSIRSSLSASSPSLLTLPNAIGTSNKNVLVEKRTSIQNTSSSSITRSSSTSTPNLFASTISSPPKPSSFSKSNSTERLTNSPMPTPIGHTKRPIGAIVGGVLGGAFGLAMVIVVSIFYRKKQRNNSDLNLLRITRNTSVSPSPSLRAEWYARMDAAMDEAARQTERARSRAASTLRPTSSHETGGWQSPDMIRDKNQYGSPGSAQSPELLPPMPDIHHGEKSRESSYFHLHTETGTGKSTTVLLQDLHNLTVPTGTSRSRSLEASELGELELERKRRREEIVERMGRVLDDSSNVFNSSAAAVGASQR